MNVHERNEMLLRAMLVQNQTLLTMVSSLPIWLAPAGVPEGELAKWGSQLAKVVGDNRDFMIGVMKLVTDGAKEERAAHHNAQSEAEKGMEAILAAEMAKPPIGFKR